MYDGHNNWIRDLCVFGKYMGSASEDRTIRVWEINTAATVAVLTGHSSGVRALIEVHC
jgi:WD40 repeat protein